MIVSHSARSSTALRWDGFGVLFISEEAQTHPPMWLSWDRTVEALFSRGHQQRGRSQRLVRAIGSSRQGERPGVPTPRKPMAALCNAVRDQVTTPSWELGGIMKPTGAGIQGLWGLKIKWAWSLGCRSTAPSVGRDTVVTVRTIDAASP